MARKRSIPNVARKAEDDAVVVAVDPLAVGRGHRDLPRGGVHESAKRPKRAKAKQIITREIRGDRGRNGSGRFRW